VGWNPIVNNPGKLSNKPNHAEKTKNLQKGENERNSAMKDKLRKYNKEQSRLQNSHDMGTNEVLGGYGEIRKGEANRVVKVDQEGSKAKLIVCSTAEGRAQNEGEGGERRTAPANVVRSYVEAKET